MADITQSIYSRPETGATVRAGIAAGTITVGNLVVLTDGGWVRANNTTAAGVDGTLGIVVGGSRHLTTGAVVSGETIDVVLHGPVFLGESSALDADTTYYTSANAGQIANATSTNARIIGQPVSGTILFFNPAPAAAA